MARLVPVTCTSIGAGAPKFRIWLTMSAGGKEKVDAGKIARQVFAHGAHIIGGGTMVLVQADEDVAILVADDAGIVVDQC